MSGWVIGLIIAIPFLFVIGVIYNSIKEQSSLEKTLPKVLAERRRRQMLPKDHPDYIYVKPYDDEDDEQASVKPSAAQAQPAAAATSSTSDSYTK